MFSGGFPINFCLLLLVWQTGMRGNFLYQRVFHSFVQHDYSFRQQPIAITSWNVNHFFYFYVTISMSGIIWFENCNQANYVCFVEIPQISRRVSPKSLGSDVWALSVRSAIVRPHKIIKSIVVWLTFFLLHNPVSCGSWFVAFVLYILTQD